MNPSTSRSNLMVRTRSFRGSLTLFLWCTFSIPSEFTSAAAAVFTYTGTLQSYVVPEGVQAIEVALWGAGGAGGTLKSGPVFAGGSGGFTSCTVAVASGQRVYVLVGGGGRAPSSFSDSPTTGTGGYNGGGDGHSSSHFWAFGGGGGRSSIQLITGVDIVTAGGGGGGGAYFSSVGTGNCGGGCGGGLTGCSSNCPQGGGGGSQTSGGIGGMGTEHNGYPGSQYQGGSAAMYGPGGGGGYEGGGAGGWSANNHGGGGGGSSYVGGCVNPLIATITKGSSGTSSGNAIPPQTSVSGYVGGVGVGSAGSTWSLTRNGGDGLVIITVSGCKAGYASFNPSTSPSSISSCILCTPGSYTSVAGSTACAPCPVGFYCTGGSKISLCSSSITTGAASCQGEIKIEILSELVMHISLQIAV